MNRRTFLRDLLLLGAAPALLLPKLEKLAWKREASGIVTPQICLDTIQFPGCDPHAFIETYLRAILAQQDAAHEFLLQRV